MILKDGIKGAEAEGKEKHVPTIKLESDGITVVVGDETPHPNTQEHYIAWVELYAVKKGDNKVTQIGRNEWYPTLANPTARFHILNMDAYESFHALSYCNIHGLWQNSVSR
jgi:superoxide reductase